MLVANPPFTASSIIFPFIIPTGTNDGAIRGVGDAHAVVTTTSDDIDNQHVSNRDHLTTTISTTTSTATATSRTSGETMDPAAVLLERPHRARDASGLLQLVEERRASAWPTTPSTPGERAGLSAFFHRRPCVPAGMRLAVGGGRLPDTQRSGRRLWEWATSPVRVRDRP